MRYEAGVVPGALCKRVMRLMGNRFEISLVAEHAAFANDCIDAAVAEISRIEDLLTTFRADSQTNRINQLAGIGPAPVDREVFELIRRSVRISTITQGAFDITYGSVDKRFWNFDVHMTALPDREAARQSVRLINYRNVILDDDACTVFLKEKGMRIGFGGIGKGYAAERARWLLKGLGIQSGIVNAAGDLSTWGLHPNGQSWTIGIADPDAGHSPFSSFNISDMAVATSGNYEKYAVINGQRYSHTIDPKTGFPVSGIRSITIICPNAELADAMTTPVMIMGIRAGLNLVNQITGMYCIIVDDTNMMHTSDNISIQ